MYAFMYLLAGIAVLAILLKSLEHLNHVSKTRPCPECRSRVDKRAKVCASCGFRVGARSI